jgi:transcriptional regulator
MNSEETYQVIKELTDKYENPETSPAAFNKMDETYIQKHLKAITGFEVSVSHIDHVFKMSQNHSAKTKKVLWQIWKKVMMRWIKKSLKR